MASTRFLADFLSSSTFLPRLKASSRNVLTASSCSWTRSGSDAVGCAFSYGGDTREPSVQGLSANPSLTHVTMHTSTPTIKPQNLSEFLWMSNLNLRSSHLQNCTTKFLSLPRP